MRKNQVERETFCLFGLNCLAFCGVFVCVPKKGSACFFLSTLSPYRVNIHGHHDGYFLGMCIEAAPFQNVHPIGHMLSFHCDTLFLEVIGPLKPYHPKDRSPEQV